MACGGVTYTADPARTIFVSDVIMGTMTPQVLQLAMMALESKEPVTIVIDSPGGDVNAGQEFITAMNMAKSKGLPLVCVAKDALSMGMAIFNACDERYAVKDGQLLWHSAWTQSNHLNHEEAQRLADELAKVDEMLLTPIHKNLEQCLTDEEFEQARKEEKFWHPDELAAKCPNYVKVIDKLEGVEFPRRMDALERLLKQITRQP